MELESLVELVSGSPWAYALIVLVAALDALIPVVPSETTVIAAGVLAGSGELELAFVIGAGAAGAYLGDSSGYWLGRSLGPRLRRRTLRSARAEARRDRAEKALRRHGAAFIFAGRFVPGGRTAATVTSGLLGMRWVRFEAVAAAAGTTWATYAGLIGYLGGRTFEDSLLSGLIAGFVIAAAVFVGIALTRSIRSRRASRRRGVVCPAGCGVTS